MQKAGRSPVNSPLHGTVGQNNQESRWMYWVTCPSISLHHSFVRMLRILVCLLHPARFTCAHRCAHWFARSLTHSTSKQMSGTNGRASGPILQSVFLVILAQSAVGSSARGRGLWLSSCNGACFLFRLLKLGLIFFTSPSQSIPWFKLLSFHSWFWLVCLVTRFSAFLLSLIREQVLKESILNFIYEFKQQIFFTCVDIFKRLFHFFYVNCKDNW